MFPLQADSASILMWIMGTGHNHAMHPGMRQEK